MRWRQVKNPQTGKYEMIPVDAAAARRDGHFVQGDIESFVSPIDGSVISDRKQYREHCEKHGVVPAQEFSDEFYARKAAERARHYTGEPYTPEEKLRNKQHIHEIINHLERQA